MNALELSVEDYLAEGEEDRARRQDHVAGEDRGAWIPWRQELIREEHHDPAESKDDAAERRGCHPVPGHEEMREEHDVDGIRVEEHRRVPRRREPHADVQETELRGEEEAKTQERPALAGPKPERRVRPHAPRDDACAADDE